jgi:hypothetical protein
MDETDSHRDSSPARRPARRWRGTARAGLGVAAQGALAGALLLVSPAWASATAPAGHHTATATMYSFTTLDDLADPTFNQLLGINSHNVISGYFGSGAAGHPNQGYLLDPPYAQSSYVSENYPGSLQTQVTGLNNKGDTVGFWVADTSGTSLGFVDWNGVFHSYVDPQTPDVAGSVNQLLGINDAGIAVGFYNDANFDSHAYKVNQATLRYTALKVPGVSSVATGINDAGDVVGFDTSASGQTSSWLIHAGHLTTFQYPGGTDTQALGINKKDQIVGSYLDGTGTTHGFVLSKPLGPVSHWTTVDDPNASLVTVVNGINNAGDLVGFYTDAANNTHGMLATP